MADTNYTDFQPPAITASWLNDLNRLHYQLLGNPQDVDDLVNNFPLADGSNNGLMSSTDKVKLDGIEENATEDMTPAEIKAAYESNPDTNAFTDTNQLKLDGIEENAKDDQDALDVFYDSVDSTIIADNVQLAIDELDLKTVTHLNSPPDAHPADSITYENNTSGLLSTDVQGAIDEIVASAGVLSFNERTGSVVPETGDYSSVQITYDNSTSGLVATTSQAAIDEVEGRVDVLEVDTHTHSNKAVLDATTASYTLAEESKLAGIEDGATIDQTGPEIKALYEAEADTNAFTDGEKTKLAGIEAGAEANTVDSVNGQTGEVILDLGTGAPTTADLVTYNRGTASSTNRTVEEKLNDVISVFDYGVAGDGVTNDTAEIQAAFTENPGRTIYFPYTTGGYYVNESIDIPADTSVLFEKGAFINAPDSTTYNQDGLFSTTGTGLGAALGGGVTSTPTKGDLSLSFTSAPAVVAGDLICLRNTASGSWNPVRTSYTQGEYCEVKSVSGTTVNLVAPLVDTYPLSAEVNVVGTTTCKFENVKIKGNNTDTENQSAIRIEFGRGVELVNIEIDEMTSRGVYVHNSFNVTAKQIITRKSTDDVVGIQSNGLTIVSCQHAHVYDSTLNADYHGCSITGGGEVVSRFCTVENSSISSRVLWAADLGHGHQEFCAFKKCVISGGVQLGGESNALKDNIIYEGAQNASGIIILSETRSPSQTISGNKIYTYGFPVFNGGSDAFDALDVNTIVEGTLKILDNIVYDYNESSKNYFTVRNAGATVEINIEISGNRQARTPVGSFTNSLLNVSVLSGDDLGTVTIENNTLTDGVIGNASTWLNLYCRENRATNSNMAALFTFTGKNGHGELSSNEFIGYNAQSVIGGVSGSPLVNLVISNNTIRGGLLTSGSRVLVTSFVDNINSSDNLIGETDDPSITFPVNYSSGGAAYGVQIDGDIYRGGPPLLGNNAFGSGSFTFEKKVLLDTPATSFNIFEIPVNMKFMPVTSQGRADTNVTAVDGDYYSIGVDAANRRVDYGSVTVAAAASRHAKNNFLQEIQYPSKTSQPLTSGEVLRLMSTTSNADAAVLGSNMGGAGESITVKIKGDMVGRLRVIA